MNTRQLLRLAAMTSSRFLSEDLGAADRATHQRASNTIRHRDRRSHARVDSTHYSDGSRMQ